MLDGDDSERPSLHQGRSKTRRTLALLCGMGQLTGCVRLTANGSKTRRSISVGAPTPSNQGILRVCISRIPWCATGGHAPSFVRLDDRQLPPTTRGRRDGASGARLPVFAVPRDELVEQIIQLHVDALMRWVCFVESHDLFGAACKRNRRRVARHQATQLRIVGK